MKPPPILLIALLLLACSCMHSRDISQTGIEAIHFGSGGGFTGEVTTYSLKDNGLIVNEENSEVTKIDKKSTLSLFRQAKELSDYTYNDPQNMYSFLEIQAADTTHRFVWGVESTSVPDKILSLHQELTDITKNN